MHAEHINKKFHFFVNSVWSFPLSPGYIIQAVLACMYDFTYDIGVLLGGVDIVIVGRLDESLVQFQHSRNIESTFSHITFDYF